MTDISIYIEGRNGNEFQAYIPEEYWLHRFAGQLEAAMVAQYDNDSGWQSRLASDACGAAEALLAELKKDRPAPSEGTEASKPEGATVLAGVGPHSVTVEWGGRRAVLSLRTNNERLYVDACEGDKTRMIGHTAFEEPD